MSSQTQIINAIHTLVESNIANSVVYNEPRDLESLLDNEGSLIAEDYEQQQIEFRQDVITYPFALLFLRKSDGDVETAKNQLYNDLEAVRTALMLDTTLGGVARDIRVSGILVQTVRGGPSVGGVMRFDARVLV